MILMNNQQIYNALISGFYSNDLSNRDLGKINHARWLTTANRLNRLYVSTEEPSNELKEIESQYSSMVCNKTKNLYCAR